MEINLLDASYLIAFIKTQKFMPAAAKSKLKLASTDVKDPSE